MSTGTTRIIVDCGSGYSRVTSFHRLTAGGGPVPVCVVVDDQEGKCLQQEEISCTGISVEPLFRAITTKSNIPALHTVIHCPVKSLEWLQQLVNIVEHVDVVLLNSNININSSDANTTTRQKVLIGATGGVRDLISAGEITATELDVFRNLLITTHLPFEASLRILSGEEEAMYEFLSAEYCARQSGYYCGYTCNDDSTVEEDYNEATASSSSSTLGLISSGGMSSQLVVKRGCAAAVHCLETQIKTGNKLGLEHGMEQGMALYYDHVENAIAEIPGDFGGMGVFFVAIEMLAAVGEKAGIGGIVMSVAEAKRALSVFIQKEVEHDQKLDEAHERTWRNYVHVMSGVVGKSILAKLHPESAIVFLREFELEDGHTLKPSWSLGCAIESL